MAGMGNGGAVGGMKVKEAVSVKDEMAAFDGLPREVRELLASAPVKLSAVGAADHVFKVGARRVVRDYRKALAKMARDAREAMA